MRFLTDIIAAKGSAKKVKKEEPAEEVKEESDNTDGVKSEPED